MAKSILVALMAMAALIVILAAPAERSSVQGSEDQEFSPAEDHLRFRRVTCDLLGFTGDSACAANCLSMGKAGGTCQDGICVCRRDTFKEQVDKRWPTIDMSDPPGYDIKEWVNRHQKN